ncbi:putative bifunctional diguanylate cyclase/phosphodiesterase [Motilibacter deserti]|uniref:EAL domain-containing protein n=1 Tax=Motilibacter deserti TaxID=2714956 RepID=A0ABX0GW18_9ACTN|nr:EAL domain-containing protein [Motilibacter deserti]
MVEPGDARLLSAVVRAIDATAFEALAVLSPVRDERGDVVDFEVLVASGLSGVLQSELPAHGERRLSLLPDGLGATLVERNRAALLAGEPTADEVTIPAEHAGPLAGRTAEVHRVPVDGLVVVLWRDVTAVRAAQAALQEREHRFRALVENGTDLILVLAPDGSRTYVSPSASRVLGYSAEELAHGRWGERAHPDDAESADSLFRRALALPQGATVSADLRVVDHQGRTRWIQVLATNRCADRAVGGVVINGRDVTDRHEALARLRDQALRDPLTGVPNRRWFHAALANAMARSERTGAQLAVVLFDVDHFKLVNDTLGHPAGDELLIELTRRLAAELRPGDTVARLSGDELAVLAEDLHEAYDAVTVAERLAASASGEYQLAGAGTRVSVSVGVALASSDQDADTVLAHADTALYAAKQQGRGRVTVYESSLREGLMRRLRIERDLLLALERDELVLHWQPIVRLTDRKVVAAEALLRWRHPTRGLLSAGEFLPHITSHGLSHEVCVWASDHALAQAAAWSLGHGPDHVFVNLSAVDLGSHALVDRISTQAATHGTDPSGVHLEVSEQVLGPDVPRVRETVAALRAQGFGIALDDFGAGNTALAWLRQLDIDVLKLDRAFTSDLHAPATRAIVRSVLQLAADLGITCLAEGVETGAQHATLSELDCPQAQGFHYAEPQPAEALA